MTNADSKSYGSPEISASRFLCDRNGGESFSATPVIPVIQLIFRDLPA